jgi:hypothetical protein
VTSHDVGLCPPVPPRPDAGLLTAGERMKADARYAEVLQAHAADVAAWQAVADRYRRVGSELEAGFGPHAFPRLMASFLVKPEDVECTQYGARGLCRYATSTPTKTCVRAWRDGGGRCEGGGGVDV